MAAVETSSSVVLIGSGMVSAMTYLLGPILGEYSVLLGAGFLGSLVALMEEPESAAGLHPYWEGFKFIFRGTALSFMFGSVLTLIAVHYIPASYNISPHAVLSPVAFSIGWTSNRWPAVRDKLLEKLSKVRIK